MRIVAGNFRGRPLISPQGQDIRPTSDKVRGAVFNTLTSMGAVEDARVLDGFCGSGALGLEALSRGASFCTFVDVSKGSLALARQNAQALGAEAQSAFELKDVTRLGSCDDPELKCDLVFLDPPYRKDLMGSALDRLCEGAWLKKFAVVVAESAKGEPSLRHDAFAVHDVRVYGATQITYLIFDQSGS